MKKFGLCILTLIGVISFSCSSDDNANNSNETPTIIGKWKITSIELNDEISTLSECHLQQTMTFQENGDLIEYAVENEMVTPCTFSTETIKYSLEGDVLTFISESEGTEENPNLTINEVLKLDESTLVYKELSQGGVSLSDNKQQIFTHVRID